MCAHSACRAANVCARNFQQRDRQNPAQYSNSGPLRCDFLGVVATKFLLVDCSGGIDGSTPFWHRVAVVPDPDGQPDFHFDYAAALFLLAVSGGGESCSLNPTAKNWRWLVCYGSIIFLGRHDSNAHRRRRPAQHHLADLGVRDLYGRRNIALAAPPS